MGWNTDFYGRFTLDRPLSAEHKAILDEFADTEHHDALGKPGSDGKPPHWYCQWVPTEDGSGIEWDGNEKFYYFEEWMEYLISHFIKPWGYVLNGSVRWIGITFETEGVLSVLDNRLTAESQDLRDPTNPI